jgi:hypothetical protein
MTLARSLAVPPLTALLLCGCSMLPRGGGEPDPGEPPVAAETPSIAAADSIPAPAAPAPPAPEPTPVEEKAPESPPERVVAVPPTSEPPLEPVVTEPEPAEPEPAEPVAPVQVELSAEERLALATEARRDLELAEQALRSEDPHPPGAGRREKLDTIRNLIDSAKAAYSEDLRAAATLAHKARLLAEELSGT